MVIVGQRSERTYSMEWSTRRLGCACTSSERIVSPPIVFEDIDTSVQLTSGIRSWPGFQRRLFSSPSMDMNDFKLALLSTPSGYSNDLLPMKR